MWVFAAMMVMTDFRTGTLPQWEPLHPAHVLHRELSALPPAATREACYLAVHDYTIEWLRRHGAALPFDIACERAS